MLQVVIADVGDKDSSYEDFLSVLPSSDCRYGGIALSRGGMQHDCVQSWLRACLLCFALSKLSVIKTAPCAMQCMIINSPTAKAASSTSWCSTVGENLPLVMLLRLMGCKLPQDHRLPRHCCVTRVTCLTCSTGPPMPQRSRPR